MVMMSVMMIVDCNINEGYNYSDSTYLAIKNYVEGRIEAGSPPSLKSIQSQIEGNPHLLPRDKGSLFGTRIYGSGR